MLSVLLGLLGGAAPAWAGFPPTMMQAQWNAPAVGQKAPDFSAAVLDGGTFTLSDWTGKRPVVLVFGSFT